MLKPPKSMFQDSIILVKTEADPNDPYGEQTIEKKTVIDNVRFSLRTVYSGSNNDRQIVSNATVVILPAYASPSVEIDDSLQGTKLIFNGKEYTITSINRDTEPFSSAVYQYKLGVI